MRELRSAVLVGREGQWAVVRAGLEAAAGGRGGVILLIGEAGVGKTRMLREVRGWSATRGIPVLAGRAVEASTPLPFRPFVEALWDADRVAPLRDDSDVAPFRAALSHLVPVWPDQGTAERPELLHVAEGFLRVARTRGGVVLLDDLQWADPDSLAVLDYLADHVPQERVLIVGAARDDAGLSAGLGALVDRRSAQRVALGRLSPGESVEMVRSCLGDVAAPVPVARLVQDRADGLPFFVEELLADLSSAGVLVHEAGGWVLRDGGRAAVPATVADSVAHRFARLATDVRGVLLDAALLGRHIDVAVLAAAGKGDDSAVLQALQAAAELGLIDMAGGGIRFRHSLTRDCLLAGMDDVERRRRSRRVLAALRGTAAGAAGVAEVAAELAEYAGEPDTAVALFREIGQRSLAQGALGSAEATQRRALALASGGPDELNVLGELVRTLALAGRGEEAFPLGEVLLARLDESGADPDGTRRGAVHLALARAAVAMTDWSLADAHLDSVPGQDPLSEAQVATVRAMVRLGQYRIDEAGTLAAAAVEAAERAEQPGLLDEALLVAGRCARVRDLDAAIRAFERARDIAQRTGSAHREARALAELGFAETYRSGRVESLQEARRLAVACGAPETEALAEHALAAAGWWHGDPSAVLTHAEAAIRLAKRYRLGQLVPATLIMAAAGHALTGNRGALDPLLTEALALSGNEEVTEMVAVHAHCLAACALAQGDLATATRELGAAADLVLQAQPTALPPLVALEPLTRALADASGSEERLAIFRARYFDLGIQVPALLSAAEAVHLGRAGDPSATRVLDGALQNLRGNGFLQAVVAWLAATAAARNGWGDPVRWLTHARAGFLARGLPAPADRCRAVLREFGGSDPVLGTLTRREREVLALVAEGLPNRAIAERLYLSARTVEKHIEHLLAKTGAANRTQLARQALRVEGEPGHVPLPNAYPDT